MYGHQQQHQHQLESAAQLTIVSRVYQELDALLERQSQRGARVPQVLEGVLRPHRLQLLLAVAVKLVEDVNEQVREDFKDLGETMRGCLDGHLSGALSGGEMGCENDLRGLRGLFLWKKRDGGGRRAGSEEGRPPVPPARTELDRGPGIV